MPTLEHISQEILVLKSSGQDSVRHKYLSALHKLTKRDTIVYFSSYNIPRPFPIPSPALSVIQDDIRGFMASLHNIKNGKKVVGLDLIIHSPGGSLEAAEQIVTYLRSKYKNIRAIIPQNAMSAATMIACACDEIVMGKHSAIGPIDPQMMLPLQNGANMSIPAHSIIQDFEKAKTDVVSNPVLANLWAPKLISLPHGYIDFCEKTIELSKAKVEVWLARYMFKNANATKAKEIATWLGDFTEHKTHGRPIGFDLAKEKGLIVSCLEDDQSLQEAVLSVFHATMTTFQTTNCLKIIENHKGKGHYVVAAFAAQPSPQIVTPGV